MSNKQITFKELLKPVNSNDVKISEKINKTNRKKASKERSFKEIYLKSQQVKQDLSITALRIIRLMQKPRRLLKPGLQVILRP